MKKIAILDDYPDFCVVMECLLSNYFEVSAFTDTSQFLATIQAEDYALVLIDLSIKPSANKKIMNGCDLIEHLKQTLPHPPLLILFTGWVSKNSLDQGKKICPLADGFFPKDTDIDYLLQEINRLIGP